MSRRPSAFDISFSDEASNISSSSSAHPSGSKSRAEPQRTLSTGASKRRSSNELRPGIATSKYGKRSKTGNEHRPTAAEAARPKLRYSPQGGDIRETATTIIAGEDHEDEDDMDKPVRILSQFCIFDPKHDMEVISLSVLDEDDDVEGRQFQAAGFVLPLFLDEEDAAQEDEQDNALQRLHTSAIFRWTLNYEKQDDPVYIETEFAWYILDEPSKVYQRLFWDFYRPHRVAQIVISAVADPVHKEWSFSDFSESYVGLPLGIQAEILQVDDTQNIDPTIWSALETLEQGEDFFSHPILQHILKGHPSSPMVHNHRHVSQRPPPLRRPMIQHGNMDSLRKQSPTTVTPLVDELALGLFNEHLRVIGPQPKAPNWSILQQQERQGRLFLFQLLEKTTVQKQSISFPASSHIQHEFWKMVMVDGEEYSVGDVILVPAGSYANRAEPDIPDDLEDLPEGTMVADFFWFAQITWINQQQKQFHVQWFEHSSRTILEEISNPKELFMCPLCGDIDIKLVVAKVTVHQDAPRSDSLGPKEYFCNFMYNEVEMSFSDLSDSGLACTDMSPPDNCVSCLLLEQRDQDNHAQQIKHGVAYHERKYHPGDYVLISNTSSVIGQEDQKNAGPALVGQVLAFHSKPRSQGQLMVTVQLLGRIGDIADQCPAKIIKDEHHLFLTDTEIDIPLEDVLEHCMVLHPDSVPDLPTWLSISPFHFFVRYFLSTPPMWNQRQALTTEDVTVCESCFMEEQKQATVLQEFLSGHKPLRALDLFGGVGALGLGLESSSCIKMTHAVEIEPSAAKTLQKNSPSTTVFNQCANDVLHYAVKMHMGLNPTVPNSIGDQKPLPRPPRPQDIDCIVAGFPCQPHSRLNMFQKADDLKSHLILNLLAWVDFLKPKFCIFENVRGFLSYNLKATQAGRYRTEGGIKMGGLKFLVRALLAMKYQVRFGLLQAAHYGAPQARVRFFLVAARSSYPLPLLPQPTHDFPLADALEIKFPNGQPKRPIRTARGVAPFPFVTIEDAIADLPRFDWENPHKLDRLSRQAGSGRAGRARAVDNRPVLPCDRTKTHCGLSGPEVQYHYATPRTSFQAKCRARPTDDLQHFTRMLKPETVERVVNIPLHAKADYRSLPPHLWEWQVANPSSANARDGYRPGLYGRLDSKGWFHTTVTNVEPTAKQSWVLNPYCNRVVSVRELARSQGFPDDFVFYAINGDVKTMQRQIGNAVPWPVAAALGRELQKALLKKWLKDQEEAIIVE